MEEAKEIQKAPSPRGKVRGFTIFLFAALVVAMVFYFGFKTAVVRGESMQPTFVSGQKVLTSHAYWLVGSIRKGDVIVLKEEKSNDYFIKRVYGLPGDRIDWSFAPQDWPMEKGDYVVPEGRIYVIGDNINHSDDSRKFGAFLESNILGKVLTWR